MEIETSPGSAAQCESGNNLLTDYVIGTTAHLSLIHPILYYPAEQDGKQGNRSIRQQKRASLFCATIYSWQIKCSKALYG